MKIFNSKIKNRILNTKEKMMMKRNNKNMKKILKIQKIRNN